MAAPTSSAFRSSTTQSTTPIRAITSSLTSRPAPSIPPSSQSYEPLVKYVLQQRLLRNIFVGSGAVCWAQSALWTLWNAGGAEQLGTRSLFVPFWPSTLLFACVTWLTAALPAIVIRKTYLTLKSNPAASPAAAVRTALSKSSTTRAMATYLISAYLGLALHIAFAYLHEKHVYGDPKLTLFVKSKKHPYYLNGRLLYLLFSQAIAALTFSLRNIMLDRFVLRSSNTHPKRPITLLTIVQALIVMLFLSTLVQPITCLVFAATRFTLPILYKLPLLHYLLRPFTAHFLRGSWTITLPARNFLLLIRSFFLGYSTLLSWEFAEAFFEVYISQPVTVSYLTPDPNPVLVSSISSTSGPFQYFAYTELKDLASSPTPASSAQRTALFGDQKYNPSLWSYLVRESLLQLGRDYQLLLRRGKPEPPAPPATDAGKGKAETGSGVGLGMGLGSTGQTPVSLPFPTTPISLKKQHVFRSSVNGASNISGKKESPMKSIVDYLASDGALAKTVEGGADKVRVPELFRSVLGNAGGSSGSGPVGDGKVVQQEQPKATTGDAGKKEEPKGNPLVRRVRSEVEGWVGGVVRAWSPGWMQEGVGRAGRWWTRERANKVAESCLPNREVDVVIIEVLSHLTCMSLTEDRYGVVQRDIPKILEAFLSFLGALDEYRESLGGVDERVPAQARAGQNQNQDQLAGKGKEKEDGLSQKEKEERRVAREEAEKAKEVVGMLSDALKEGVGRIVRTFGDKLLAFKFPPRIAHKLQGFMDYC
ncbi:hypothetical protein AMATHDRAFT_8848 [Amanita thiersii Skay4041]|uniref:Nucleoporin NDC1 n=1 Tax=Amanita thiersii Skay4041 TaxID=703135 RepID=A0A2A9NDE6_9AGAR|nr:hypothetical protein AMATHDRAFT_8848 [Amanita thiersii Skay4041]